VKIIRWEPGCGSALPGQMLEVTPQEAAALVSSILSQMKSKSPNAGRKEFAVDTPNGAEYFTVSVVETNP